MSQNAAIKDGDMTLAGWTRSIKRSALQDMLVASARPGILSFALGLPAAELFPVADYSEAVASVLATDPRALQYGPPFQPLKQHAFRVSVRCAPTAISSCARPTPTTAS